MSVVSIQSIISPILTPVVLVTSCTLILNGLLTRYGAVNDRLRAMSRERLDLVRTARNAAGMPGGSIDPLVLERLEEIDAQIPGLLHRHRMLRNAVFSVYSGMGFLVISMCVIALAVFRPAGWLDALVLALLLAGTLLLLFSVLLTAREVRISQQAVDYEVQRVAALPYR